MRAGNFGVRKIRSEASSPQKLAIVAFLEKSLPIISGYAHLVKTIFEKFSYLFELKSISNEKTIRIPWKDIPQSNLVVKGVNHFYW